MGRSVSLLPRSGERSRLDNESGFFERKKKYRSRSFCMYGMFNAFTVMSVVNPKSDYHESAFRMLGSLDCLNFLESTNWRLRRGDLQQFRDEYEG